MKLKIENFIINLNAVKYSSFAFKYPCLDKQKNKMYDCKYNNMSISIKLIPINDNHYLIR